MKKEGWKFLGALLIALLLLLAILGGHAWYVRKKSALTEDLQAIEKVYMERNGEISAIRKPA